ncbi:hypothetical protein ACLHZ9_06770 [Aeromonas media]
MSRYDLKYQLRYSHAIEDMHKRYLERWDSFLSFLQIILGSAVFADFGGNMIFGSLLVSLSTISFVWQPGKHSLLFAKRAEYYAHLIICEPNLTDEELRVALCEATEGAPSEYGVLIKPAEMRAAYALGTTPTGKLTACETVAAFIAGDVPRA